MNDKSNFITFESRKRKSNIDLIILSNQLVSLVKDWKISEEEDCSDHRIISFNIVNGNFDVTEFQYRRIWYVFKESHYEGFDWNWIQELIKNFYVLRSIKFYKIWVLYYSIRCQRKMIFTKRWENLRIP